MSGSPTRRCLPVAGSDTCRRSSRGYAQTLWSARIPWTLCALTVRCAQTSGNGEQIRVRPPTSLRPSLRGAATRPDSHPSGGFRREPFQTRQLVSSVERHGVSRSDRSDRRPVSRHDSDDRMRGKPPTPLWATKPRIRPSQAGLPESRPATRGHPSLVTTAPPASGTSRNSPSRRSSASAASNRAGSSWSSRTIRSGAAS